MSMAKYQKPRTNVFPGISEVYSKMKRQRPAEENRDKAKTPNTEISKDKCKIIDSIEDDTLAIVFTFLPDQLVCKPKQSQQNLFRIKPFSS